MRQNFDATIGLWILCNIIMSYETTQLCWQYQPIT